jgi:hypothetical protein
MTARIGDDMMITPQELHGMRAAMRRSPEEVVPVSELGRCPTPPSSCSTALLEILLAGWCYRRSSVWRRRSCCLTIGG